MTIVIKAYFAVSLFDLGTLQIWVITYFYKLLSLLCLVFYTAMTTTTVTAAIASIILPIIYLISLVMDLGQGLK